MINNKITISQASKLASGHSCLLFWGEAAANNLDMKQALGRYDEPNETVIIAEPMDDLTKKFAKLVELGVQFKIKKHNKTGNFFVSDTFPEPSTTPSQVADSAIKESYLEGLRRAESNSLIDRALQTIQEAARYDHDSNI